MKATDFKVGSRYYFYDKNASGEFLELDSVGDPVFINVKGADTNRYCTGGDGKCRFFKFDAIQFEPVESEVGDE